jgi:hypothetical protein
MKTLQADFKRQYKTLTTQLQTEQNKNEQLEAYTEELQDSNEELKTKILELEMECRQVEIKYGEKTKQCIEMKQLLHNRGRAKPTEGTVKRPRS